jgi:pimeloyl-ACP methyl ester carboxylesterase
VSSVISKDGTKITYDKRGSGPVVILVLGALNKRGSGKNLSQQLSDHFTVVSYDRRGRGDSTDILPYKTEKEVEDLEALIDNLGGSAYLYGHSSGAVLALLATKELKEKIKGLALYELPYNADPQAQKVAQEYQKTLKSLLAEDKPGEAVASFIKPFGVSDKQIAAMQRMPMWKGMTKMAHTLVYDTVELMEQYPKIVADAISTPALVMYGAASPTFMGETAKKLVQALPNATLQMLEGQTHDVKAEMLAPYLLSLFR